MAEEKKDATAKKDETTVAKKAERGARKSILKRIWHFFFRSGNDDFEKKLKHLSNEEAAVHMRLKQRTQTWRKLARGLVLYSVIIELLILGISILATKAPELTWQMRALRVLPVFAFPAAALGFYSMCASYYRIRERNDQKRLDYLRVERQSKIDELKEKTNYYIMQQLIQEYDSDPTAKEAAARVLASKLGSEAGLEVSFRSTAEEEAAAATVGVRRRPPRAGTGMTDAGPKERGGASEEGSVVDKSQGGSMKTMMSLPPPMEVAHGRANTSDNGWLARMAAMLVGEDPTQCFALICGNCSMHNGLARKEDYNHIAYYCPHCRALNRSPQSSTSEEISRRLQAAAAATSRSMEATYNDSDITNDMPQLATSSSVSDTLSQNVGVGESSSKLD